MIHAIPPHSMNCWRASTSTVTRATNTPRFSSDCSALDSARMWETVRTRRPIIALPAAFTTRLSAARAATNATVTRISPARHVLYTYVGSHGLKPWSKIRWISTGVMSETTVTPSETITVRNRPRRSSGDSPMPRFSTGHAPWRSSEIGIASSSPKGRTSSLIEAHHLVLGFGLVGTDDRRVPGLGREQLVVTAGRRHAAALQEDHPVGQADRRQAVRDDDQGGVELAPERAEDVRLDRRIDRRGGVVQD